MTINATVDDDCEPAPPSPKRLKGPDVSLEGAAPDDPAPPYIVKLSAKAKVARLHLWEGCRHASDPRPYTPIYDLDKAVYTSFCHKCWPGIARPLRESTSAPQSILAKAGLAPEAFESSSESSSTDREEGS